jgi:hypothetical protein
MATQSSSMPGLLNEDGLIKSTQSWMLPVLLGVLLRPLMMLLPPSSNPFSPLRVLWKWSIVLILCLKGSHRR